MVSSTDFIQLDYTPDLTQAGIAYANQALVYTHDRASAESFKTIRQIVSQKAAELALIRYLVSEDVPHYIRSSTPFSAPDNYTITIGGRRCALYIYLIHQKTRIRQINQHPEQLLKASALVPSDQIEAEQLSKSDLYCFGFISALLTKDRQSLRRALAANQPVHLLQTLPSTWAYPSSWKNLGALQLRSEASQSVQLTVTGQSMDRSLQTETIILPAQKNVQLSQDFYALSHLSTQKLLNGQIALQSLGLKQTYYAKPTEWGNIWVYGMAITLTGYMTFGEFQKRAVWLPPGSPVFQTPRTQVKNLALPIPELYPFSEVLSAAKRQQGSVWI
jgi:hypothetical protein